MSEADGFLSRWSRRKTQQARGETPVSEKPGVDQAPSPSPSPGDMLAAQQPGGSLPVNPPAHAAGTRESPAAERPPAPTLADAAELTPESDFRRFVKPDVDPSVRNAAVKKLFADPHFNVMDGLDTYIDDYHNAELLPAAALRQMVAARALGMLDDELTPQPRPDALASEAQPALAANDDVVEGLPAAEPSPMLTGDAAPAANPGTEALAELDTRLADPPFPNDLALNAHRDV